MALPPVFLVPHCARLCPRHRGQAISPPSVKPYPPRPTRRTHSILCGIRRNAIAAMQPCKTGNAETPGTGPAAFRRSTEHAPLGRQAEQDLADGLEMDRPALALLRAGIHVAQPPLERVGLEDRGRSGGMIHGRDDVARLVDRPGCGEPKLDVLVGAEFALFL